MNKCASIEKITALTKRRGFLYPSSDIYGGLANSWDFGHYGALLKKNIQDKWLNTFVIKRNDMIMLEAGIFLNSKVWEASGHVKNFTDALVDCKNCKNRTRADHLIENAIKNIKVEGKPPEELSIIINENKLTCPACGSNELTSARKFNLLFETKLGIVEDVASKVFLRGELAQGIFINFKNILDTNRIRVPFGIAQIGKVFRNEITSGQLVHRTLEFDLMEFEYFIKESEWEKTFEVWKNEMWSFCESLGIHKENLRWREHEPFERSFYSSKTMDIEYEYPFGWKEMFGIAYRSDYDLKNHMEKSGAKLDYKDPKTGEVFIPHVIEPTFGLSRLVGVILFDCYKEEKVEGKERIVLQLPPSLAPIKTAVFPLQKDSSLQQKAKETYSMINEIFVSEYDDAGNIGKMYRRQDEIGTPYCITVDYQTLEDDTITVRMRDSMKQERISRGKITAFLKEKILV